MKNLSISLLSFLFLFVNHYAVQSEFPTSQPKNGNFNRPLPNQVLDISPPGFCWWRSSPRGEVKYRLIIKNSSGEEIYQSQLLNDPVHVPNVVLSAGLYSWVVEAIGDNGKLTAIRPVEEFTITEGAYELPWVEPEILLKRVPREHPRLLFPKSKLDEIQESITGSRSKPFAELKLTADEALEYDLMEKPDFDKFDRETEFEMRRTAYRASYHEFTRFYNRGMVPLALVYLLTGEEKYGLAAKKHLLNLLDWETDGIASLEPSFDEIGLRIARTAAQGYDWLHDILTDEERESVRRMLIKHGDQMLARLERRDFLFKSAYSHDGRLPGYLVEFSIALAEEERAKLWIDYAMRALLTVFPHWGGNDGGWAEGINYALSYNERFITPLQSLYEATGYDLWQKSYFRKMRHFIVYCISPIGEVAPFGDGEHQSIKNRTENIEAILLFHALRYNDNATRWWIDQLPEGGGNSDRLTGMHKILLEDNLKPEKPETIAQDRAFFGVGWAALHTDILNPKKDLMILFKSSTYGPVSHSHADQNSFAILKGGKALTAPSGARYPQHQSPFHFQYTNLTVAHNALLINGEGQIDRDSEASGLLDDFKSTQHLGYVSGDAKKCYGDRLDSYKRHVVLIRPSVILIVDDLSAPEPISIDWLLHSREEMILDQNKQIITTSRFDQEMKTHLFTPGGLDFELNNEWPIDPKQDYPMVTAEPPAKEWHFSATVNEIRKEKRIAAVMTIKENGEYPEYNIDYTNGILKVNGNYEDDKWSAVIQIKTETKNKPIIEINYHPADSDDESIVIDK